MAREIYGLSLREATFEEMALPEDRYDAVTMVDFIEHVPQPYEAVLKARRVLAPGGLLCLVTPDIRSVAARLMGKRWWHFRPAHLGFFTGRSLDVLMERAGLRIIQRKKYAWTFSASYLLSRRPRTRFLAGLPLLGLLLKKIPIKLALRDSFEIYAKKDKAG